MTTDFGTEHPVAKGFFLFSRFAAEFIRLKNDIPSLLLSRGSDH